MKTQTDVEQTTKPRANEPQEIQYRRLELGSFNNLDGERVAKSLRDNKRLWKSFVFGRFGHFDLIELRDLADGYLNADTIYILTDKRSLADLLIVIHGWDADEVHYQTEDKNLRLGGGLEKDWVLVRVWWD